VPVIIQRRATWVTWLLHLSRDFQGWDVQVGNLHRDGRNLPTSLREVRGNLLRLAIAGGMSLLLRRRLPEAAGM
jgi:hypothetical protein